MWLGIILIALGVAEYFSFMVLDIIKGTGHFVLAIVLSIIAIGGGLLLVPFSSNMPTYTDVPYSVDIDGREICFKDYQREGNNILIPTHYYVEESWINSWEYCDTPIKIIVAEGSILLIEERILQTEPPKPYIVGGCK